MSEAIFPFHYSDKEQIIFNKRTHQLDRISAPQEAVLAEEHPPKI